MLKKILSNLKHLELCYKQISGTMVYIILIAEIDNDYFSHYNTGVAAHFFIFNIALRIKDVYFAGLESGL